MKTRETVPALVRTVPGVGKGPPVPLDRDTEGGFDRGVAALGPARDVGVGVHRSRIRLLGEGGQDADRVADADMESPAELGDRPVEGLRSGEERSAPVGPAASSSAGSITSTGTISSWARWRQPRRDCHRGGGRGGTRRWRWTSIRLRAVGGVRMLSAEMDRNDLAVSGLETIACGKVTRSSDQRRVPGAASRVPAMPYEVHTPVFDGPFDLLLHLILREQVDLYEINLNEIVDAYLGELDRMEQLDLEVATEFLLIAATLVELKARRLLPDDDEIDLDDELGLWEERDLAGAPGRVQDLQGRRADPAQLTAVAARSYPRQCGPVEEHFLSLAPDLLEKTTPEDLRAAFLKATAPKPVVRVDLSHVTPIKVTVAEAVEELVKELPGVGQMTFRALTADLVDRIEVVVRFLAVLELFKQGVVELDQASAFGDITVIWTGGEGVSADAIVIDTYEG